MKNRILPLLMALVLLAGLAFPSAAFADGIVIVEETEAPQDSTSIYSVESDSALASDEEQSGNLSEEEVEVNLSTDANDNVIDPGEILNVMSVNPLEGGGTTVSVDSSGESQATSNGVMLFAASSVNTSSYSSDKSKIAATFRQEMVNRTATIDLYFQADAGYTNKDDLINLSYEFFNLAVAHTGNGDEGDYLKWNYHSWKASISYLTDTSVATYLHYQYAVEYYTTAAEESVVTTDVQNLISSLGLSSMQNDYHKVAALYDWICTNVSYDNAHSGDSTYYLQHTAYAALENHTCVCQGYANLMYRVLCEAGVSVRFVGSIEQTHAWNIVQIDGSWYELDSTWDAQRQQSGASYIYFLKGSSDFTNHYGGDTDQQVTLASTGCPLHTWSATATTTATCTEAGYSIKKCNNCSEEERTETSALGHDWQLVSSQGATCTVAGTARYQCSRCAETKTVTDQALGHQMELSSTTAATCETAGIVVYKCTRDGCTYSETETTEALGHLYATAPSSNTATCEAAGVAVYPCTREGCTSQRTETVAALGHEWVETATTPATCTEAETTTSKCSRCGATKTETTGSALGHDPVAMEDTETTIGGTKCSRCGIVLTQPSSKITVSGMEITAGQTVYFDGVAYTATENGAVPASYQNCKTAVTYSYNKSSNDPHEVYPTGMQVWLLSKNSAGNLSATRAPELDNLLTYSGTAIRISGNQGIRIKTTIQKSTRNTLISSGLYGYQLKEYGTIVSWAATNSNPTYGGSGVMTGQAYVRGSRDNIISETDTTLTYANVLTFTDMSKTVPDLAIRPYIVLTNGTDELVLYGGILIRSVYSVAVQLQNSFPQGSSGYNFVWNIINYGNKNAS